VFNIIKFAGEQGIKIDESVDLDRLEKDEERQLIRKLLQYPEVISRAAQFWEPHRLTNYLQELAATFHHFYHIHRVVTDDIQLSKARLLLCQATQIVFANGLKILGITAPKRM
jgi:arginyl-tRNA synthetase